MKEESEGKREKKKYEKRKKWRRYKEEKTVRERMLVMVVSLTVDVPEALLHFCSWVS